MPEREADNPARGDLSLARLSALHRPLVERFFERHAADSAAASLFHPHPFTAEEADRIATYSGRDCYAGLFTGGVMAAYGMLRGWDEGYAVPSLGVAVDGGFRGLGFGRLMMEYLHAVARVQNAPSIMLKVYKSNEPAVSLYRTLGYTLVDLNDREWRGTLTLGPPR